MSTLGQEDERVLFHCVLGVFGLHVDGYREKHATPVSEVVMGLSFDSWFSEEEDSCASYAEPLNVHTTCAGAFSFLHFLSQLNFAFCQEKNADSD